MGARGAPLFAQPAACLAVRSLARSIALGRLEGFWACARIVLARFLLLARLPTLVMGDAPLASADLGAASLLSARGPQSRLIAGGRAGRLAGWLAGWRAGGRAGGRARRGGERARWPARLAGQ